LLNRKAFSRRTACRNGQIENPVIYPRMYRTHLGSWLRMQIWGPIPGANGVWGSL